MSGPRGNSYKEKASLAHERRPAMMRRKEKCMKLLTVVLDCFARTEVSRSYDHPAHNIELFLQSHLPCSQIDQLQSQNF